MYQTKPRLNAFEQPSFLRHKKPIDTFWDDDDVRPFRLSMPEHFSPPVPNKVFPQKQNDEPIRNYAPSRDNRPANRQRQRQHTQQPRTFTNRQNESYIYNRPHSTLVSYFVQKIYTNWIEKELYFSMSKLSFLVLIIGLFFLSSLLFITGFLVAVNIYDIGAPKLPPITNFNLPTIEAPHLTAPTVTMPGVPTMAPVAIMPPAAPNPNIMKMGTQGGQMADVPMTDTAHMPSAYAQLPAQALSPAPQPMPHSGGHYIPLQQAQTIQQHVPSQGYAQQQSPYPQQAAPVQAPAPQQQVATTQQHYMQQPYNNMQQANQPSPYSGPYYQPQTGTR